MSAMTVKELKEMIERFPDHFHVYAVGCEAVGVRDIGQHSIEIIGLCSRDDDEE